MGQFLDPELFELGFELERREGEGGRVSELGGRVGRRLGWSRVGTGLGWARAGQGFGVGWGWREEEDGAPV